MLEGWTSYVMIAVGMLTLLAIIGLSATELIQYRGRIMTEAHDLTRKTKSWKTCALIEPGPKEDFISGQRTDAVNLGDQHRKNAIAYFSYFYTTYLLVTIFGLIAAISLAVITKGGISSSSPHLIAVFLISTAVVVLYQGSLDTLKQKANIDLNTSSSIKYAVLVDQIDTYCTTGKVAMRDPNDVLLAALPKSAGPANSSNQQPDGSQNSEAQTKILPFFVEPDGDQFINFIAWQMERLRNFAITIDDTKVGPIDSKRFLF